MKELVAIIEIGSTGIRLVAAEINSGSRDWRVLDQAEKPVALGMDVFSNGRVSRESLLDCLSIIRSYKELLQGWGIESASVQVIATSAIRAARNRDLFVDRMRQETGFQVTIIDGIEENRLMYLALRFALGEDLHQFWRSNSMVVDLGGGSTEIMLLRRGKVAAAHSLRLGTVLIGRHARRARVLGEYLPTKGFAADWSQDAYLAERVRSTIEFLNAEMELSGLRSLVFAGTDARYLAPGLGRKLNEHCWAVSRETFIKAVNEIKESDAETWIKQYGVSNIDAPGFVAANLVYKLILERTGAAEALIPLVSIREGLLIDLAMGVDSELQEEFFSQTIASALNLGRRYRFDEAHNRHVARLSLLLFDALVKEHGMGRRERMLLETAATLHDIGMFIRGWSHQKHGQYIVAHSEIFGLHSEEQAVIANVVGYHRGAMPDETDFDYMALQREERTQVLKMAALLRVADALDRSHSQRIRNFSVERRPESNNATITIHTEDVFDLSTERLSLEEKGLLFQDVFGYKVLID